jgi:hypothetical protein
LFCKKGKLLKFPFVPGIYISRVEEGSVAERAGLRPGDSILQVNGTPFTGISHEEALKVCKMVCCFFTFLYYKYILIIISNYNLALN